MQHITKFAADDSGATAIEYGLIAALISVGCIAALQTLATNLNATFNNISAQLSAANK